MRRQDRRQPEELSKEPKSRGREEQDQHPDSSEGSLEQTSTEEDSAPRHSRSSTSETGCTDASICQVLSPPNGHSQAPSPHQSKHACTLCLRDSGLSVQNKQVRHSPHGALDWGHLTARPSQSHHETCAKHSHRGKWDVARDYREAPRHLGLRARHGIKERDVSTQMPTGLLLQAPCIPKASG